MAVEKSFQRRSSDKLITELSERLDAVERMLTAHTASEESELRSIRKELAELQNKQQVSIEAQNAALESIRERLDLLYNNSLNVSEFKGAMTVSIDNLQESVAALHKDIKPVLEAKATFAGFGKVFAWIGNNFRWILLAFTMFGVGNWVSIKWDGEGATITRSAPVTQSED